MINEERIKAKVKRGIAIKPTHVTLMRKSKVSNGMRGGPEKEDPVSELDIFIDDSKHNLVTENVNDSGSFKRTRGMTMLAVAEGFEIREGDTFQVNGMKYRVTYPGMIAKDVYNADLEVIR